MGDGSITKYDNSYAGKETKEEYTKNYTWECSYIKTGKKGRQYECY